jgi:hypothetical protein
MGAMASHLGQSATSLHAPVPGEWISQGDSEIFWPNFQDLELPLDSFIQTDISPTKEIYMNYIGVSELKQTRRMWEMLDSDGELVLTKEGKPGAVILAVTPETLETTVRSIRRARFSDVVARIRLKKPILDESEIEKEIADYRADRA